MSRPASHLSFFGTLRRERHLFALVVTLLLALNLLQSNALAWPAQPDVGSICYGLGAEGNAGGVPGTPRPDCPICAAGHCATMSVAAKALLLAGAAFDRPASDAELLRPGAALRVASTPSGPPPSIRAPPFGI